MLKKVIDYLNQNPEFKEIVKNGKASLIGLSKNEQRAVIEVVGGNSSVLTINYW